MLLALDTSTDWASVALFDGRDVIAEETWRAQRRQGDELFPAIERALLSTRTSLSSVDRVAVAVGPGSFPACAGHRRWQGTRATGRRRSISTWT